MDEAHLRGPGEHGCLSDVASRLCCARERSTYSSTFQQAKKNLL